MSEPPAENPAPPPGGVEPPDPRAALYLAALRAMFWILVGSVFVFAGRMVWPLVSALGGILAPFAAALVIAYIFHPIVRFVEMRLHIGRAMGIVTVTGLILIALTLFVVILVPILYNQADESFTGISAYLEKIDVDQHPVFSKLPDETREGIREFIKGETILESFGGFLRQAARHLFGSGDTAQPEAAGSMPGGGGVVRAPAPGGGVVRADDATTPVIRTAMGTETGYGAHPAAPGETAPGAGRLDSAYDFMRKTIGTTVSLAGWIGGSVANIVLTLVVAFYFLLEMSRIPSVIRKLLPVASREKVWAILLRANHDVGGFLRGQLTACVGVGILTMLLLFIIGPRKYAVLIGFLAGSVNFIPYLGPAAGATPALLYALVSPAFETWGDRGLQVLLVLGGFGLVQAIDGFVFQPFIVGRQSALHPLAVMLALAAGAQLGVTGMILAVPMACVVKVFFGELYWKHRKDFMEPPEPAPAPGGRPRWWGRRKE